MEDKKFTSKSKDFVEVKAKDFQIKKAKIIIEEYKKKGDNNETRTVNRNSRI